MSTTPITNPLLKFEARPTRSNAIKAKCAECMGCTRDAIEPGFRVQVRDCTSRRCPLWAFRPYQRSDAEESDE